MLGPGGSGKTRLAVQAARAQAGQYADGIYFVDLQPVEAAELLAPAIMHTLSAPASGSGDAPVDQLITHLRERETLLVLDNLEHLLDGVDLLPRLLAGAPGVKLLVTSRARPEPGGGMALAVGGYGVAAGSDVRRVHWAILVRRRCSWHVQRD